MVSKSIYPGLSFIISVLFLVYPKHFLAFGAMAKLTAFLPTLNTQAFSTQSVVVFHLFIWLSLPFSETGKVEALVGSEGIFSYQLLSQGNNARR